MEPVSAFGTLLRRQRKARDLTQESLAQAAFCALDTIKKLESGRRRPSRQMAIQLADVLVLTGEERAVFLAAARHGNESDVPVAEARQDEAPDAVTQLPHVTPQTHRAIGLIAQPASTAPWARPSGTVTFLFTDIAGSTRLWEQHPDLMLEAFQRQEAILRQAIGTHGGYAYKMIGDAFQAAFATAPQALAAALGAQRALAAEDWGAIGSLRVRMALDSGVVEERGDDYVGPLLNRTARVLASGHGRQILLSAAAHELVWNQLPEGVSLRDLGTHQLKDITRPEHVFQVVASDLPSDFRPLKTQPPDEAVAIVHRRLPRTLTPFIGRNHELSDLVTRLRHPDARLVTLVAPGGMGKTRLALAAAEQLLHADAFADGVAFAALAPLGDPSGLDPTLASALGLPLDASGRRSPRVQLLDYLRAKELLLVLDNCEHVREASAELASAILTEAPGVTLLATSRERLGLRVERISLLDGMVTEADGVALFALTAQAVQPAFLLNDTTRPQVAMICARVGGMPLAIELAAGWADTLSLAEIAAELARSDELLATQAGDVPARHRSVRAVCDSTWARLSLEDQAIFAQLAVFRGGATRRALQVVTEASLGQLHALVGKALLRYDPERERYSVHELLRQYAEERLGHDPAAGQVARERHAAYYLAALAERERMLKGARQVQALDEIGKDIENVHAAWGWAAAGGRAELLALACHALGLFYEWQGRYAEGLAAFSQANERFAQTDSSEASAVLALTLAWRAAFQRALGQNDAAQQALDQADLMLAGFAPNAPPALASFVALQRGHLAGRMDLQAAHAAYTRSLQAARTSEDFWTESQALAGLGEAYNNLADDLVEAAHCWQACLRLQRAHADELGAITTLSVLSMNARYRGQLQESLALAQESYELARSVGTPVQRANTALHLGFANQWLGHLDTTISFLEEALQLETEFGNLNRCGQALSALGSALSLTGRYPQATDLLERGLTINRQTGNIVYEHDTLVPLIWTALAAGEYDCGQRYLAEAIPIMQQRGVHSQFSIVLALGALLERKIGNRVQAKRWSLAALRETILHRLWLGLGATLLSVALLLADQGEVERAVELAALNERERDVPKDQVARDIFWTEMDALLATLPADVVAAARERGRRRDFWATGQELLTELEAVGWGME